MHWSEMTEGQPRLAALARERLIGPGVVLVATIRRDGTPRLSPVEPFVLDGDLWLSMMWQSTKARDLLRDPRILVHSVITSRDGAEGEVKLRGSGPGRAGPGGAAPVRRGGGRQPGVGAGAWAVSPVRGGYRAGDLRRV